MIFSSILIIAIAGFMVLDGTHLYKKHRVALFIEYLAFIALLALNFENLFPESTAKASPGSRIDLIILLAVVRESILGRLRSHVQRRDLTDFVRGRAVALANEVRLSRPSNFCPSDAADAAKHSV